MQDDLLPHVTGGFRGRAITVASVEYDPWMKFTRCNMVFFLAVAVAMVAVQISK